MPKLADHPDAMRTLTRLLKMCPVRVNNGCEQSRGRSKVRQAS